VAAALGTLRKPGLERLLSSRRCPERELYAALDWLRKRQWRIEKALAERHLKEGTLLLYDVTVRSRWTSRSARSITIGQTG
jgi:hypothetical protein